MAYTIAAARRSEIFSAVVVSTDSGHYSEIAQYYGAEVPFLRPSEFSRDLSPDIEWVEYTLTKLREQGRNFDCFSLLRPTSPFRMANTIRRAWREFTAERGIDSLRAVEKCKQHPGKMWIVRGTRMLPLLPLGPATQPWHSSQYPSLPEVYVQNASLEMARTGVVFEERSISGTVLMPFFTKGWEGFDLNQPYDWRLAEQLIQEGEATLPAIEQVPFSG